MEASASLLKASQRNPSIETRSLGSSVPATLRRQNEASQGTIHVR